MELGRNTKIISATYQELADRSYEPLFYCDRQGKILYANTEWQKIFDLYGDDCLGNSWQQLILPAIQGQVIASWNKSLQDAKAFNIDCEIKPRNQEIRRIHIHVLPVALHKGEVSKYVGCIEDLTTIIQHEHEIISNAEKYQLLVKYSPDCIAILNDQGQLVSINQSGLEMFAIATEKEIIGVDFLSFVSEPDQENVTKILANSRQGSASFSEFCDHDENIYKACFIPTLIGDNERIIVIIQDITTNKQNENTIWRQQNFDNLTQLANRNMFNDMVDLEVKNSQAKGKAFAVLFIDLDRFKEVNDTLGHKMGDVLLVEAASRIIACVRETDLVGRFGGDEFIILLNNIDEYRDLDKICETLITKLAAPYYLEEETAIISASIGISCFPQDAVETETLFKYADQALFEAKKRGKNRHCFFEPKMQYKAKKDRRLLNDMREALLKNEFQLYYQPIVNLRTDEIHKAEALIRWNHPVKGLVSPGDFIPVAEETGIIIDVGNWVFYQAIQQIRNWRSEYQEEIQVSINKSPVQFLSQRLRIEDNWVEHIHHMKLPGDCITIEITEGLLLESESFVTQKLEEYRKAGCQVSLDDFGTGYSSLAYLKKFNIDYLKIDQGFVKDIEINPDNFALCEAIIAMAQKLKIKVVAEGIENQTQLDMLKGAGCDYGQGYLFSKPVPADVFSAKFLTHASEE